jgi:hypothetical protein
MNGKDLVAFRNLRGLDSLNLTGRKAPVRFGVEKRAGISLHPIQTTVTLSL